MEKKYVKTAREIFAGVHSNWDVTEAVEITTEDGKPVTLHVRGGMQLQELFEMSMEMAWGVVSDGGQVSDVFADMIIAQGIIDRLTDLPLPNDMDQLEIDECYELVYGYNGIINQLDPKGPARFLIDRVQQYTKSQIEAFLRDPDFVRRIEEEEDEPEIIGLEELRNMQKNNS